MDNIKDRVHELYWKEDINCACTMLRCLSEQFRVPLEPQVIAAAGGMHGAGGFRAQCGLVEGALMFLGIYCKRIGKPEETARVCYRYAEAFERRFDSLRCHDLRPTGFSEDDPPHMCEKLTCEAVAFAIGYIMDIRRDYNNEKEMA